ncbi:MAG: hypothetical protein ACR2QW_17000, partial [bacterium]
MSNVYKSLVALIALALLIGFWQDNSIGSSLSLLWWIPIIVAYLYLCLNSPISHLPPRLQYAVAGVSGVLILLSLYLFDDVLTVYLAGAIILFGLLVTRYLLDGDRSGSRRSQLAVVLLIAGSLLFLPVSVNRVVVKLPNLSAGTYLTLDQPGVPDIN